MCGNARWSCVSASGARSLARWRCLVLLLPVLLAWGCATEPETASSPASRETVVLLHGLGRHPRAMHYLEYRLTRAGFEVFNIGYPSTELPPESLVRLLHDRVQLCCAEKQKVHFVAHSLGGLLVRAMLAEKRPVNLGRVVILGTPNQGAQLVDLLGDTRLFKSLAGPAGGRLGTGEQSFPHSLPTPDYELGVIAGTHSLNPVGSWLLKGPDDGIVSVESTRVAGMKDFMLVNSDHVMMRFSDQVVDAVIQFLRTGYFRSREK